MSMLVKSKAVCYSSSWIIDSTYTSHMTFDSDAFVAFEFLNNASVETGIKAQTRVADRGAVALTINDELV